MSVKISARGIERTLERLERLGDTSRIEKALDECAAKVERDATLHAPIDTGQTRAQIDVVSYPGKRIVWSLGKAAVMTEYSPLLLKHGTVANPRQGPWPYGPDNKKGTNRNATMPWLRPALYSNQRWIRARIQRALKESA